MSGELRFGVVSESVPPGPEWLTEVISSGGAEEHG